MITKLFAVLVSVLFLLGVSERAVSASTQRPNILVILADDLGFTDIGAFGGEIRTPNIDALVADGIQLTDFHTAPSCGPTRAMLMSGSDSHRVGLGVNPAGLPRLPFLKGQAGYEGYLNESVVTFASTLQVEGYATYMAGKWDLGTRPGYFPIDRGFDRSYALLHGGASHFEDKLGMLEFLSPALYQEDNRSVDKLPAGFYSSEFYTDKVIEYIQQDSELGKPFFAYLAYTAPHWPLQVPDDWQDRYSGAYDQGWDEIRKQRVARMKELGLLAATAEVPARLPSVPAWGKLSPMAQKVEARKMEIYAAMIENMDFHIGRLSEYLKETGQYDNTFIIFASDNGAEGNSVRDLASNTWWLPATFDNRYDNMGKKGSYIWLGEGWAQASVTPGRMYKSYTSEGGIRTPAVIKSNKPIPGDKRRDDFVTIMDIAPTALELAGVTHPGNSGIDNGVLPMTGRSMLAYLNGDATRVHAQTEAVGFELYGRRALRKGDWKLLWLWPPAGIGSWQLYNLAEDPTESNDLSTDHPDKKAELIADWESYVAENGVYLFDRDAGY